MTSENNANPLGRNGLASDGSTPRGRSSKSQRLPSGSNQGSFVYVDSGDSDYEQLSSGQSAPQDVSTTTPDLFHASHYDLKSSSSLLNTLLRLSEQWSAEQAVAESPATVDGQQSTVPTMQPLGVSVPNIPCRAPTVHSSASRDSATINTLLPGVTTTLMIRNIPLRFTPCTFRDLVDTEGYSGRYDYLYMPMDFRSHRSLGYCFINFYEPKWANDFTCKFANRMFPSTNSDKVLAISAATRQGMLANVASFKQSTLRQMPKS